MITCDREDRDTAEREKSFPRGPEGLECQNEELRACLPDSDKFLGWGLNREAMHRDH